jgi:hypothetical protein
MLKGSELLAAVKAHDGASKSELVRNCGYVSTKKDGNERLNFTAFYEALLEAKGVSLDAPGGEAAAGRKLSYRATVHFNGNLLIGKAYVLGGGYAPGDVFEVRPRRGGGFALLPTDADGAVIEGPEATVAEPPEREEEPAEEEEPTDEELSEEGLEEDEAEARQVLNPVAATAELAGAGAGRW